MPSDRGKPAPKGNPEREREDTTWVLWTGFGGPLDGLRFQGICLSVNERDTSCREPGGQLFRQKLQSRYRYEE